MMRSKLVNGRLVGNCCTVTLPPPWTGICVATGPDTLRAIVGEASLDTAEPLQEKSGATALRARQRKEGAREIGITSPLNMSSVPRRPVVEGWSDSSEPVWVVVRPGHGSEYWV